MKNFLFVILIAIVFNITCDSYKDPALPEIFNYSLTLTNNEGIALSNTIVKTYYTKHKPDFVVDSFFTSVQGQGNFISLAPRDYILKAFNTSGTELGTTTITVFKDNKQNIKEWVLDVYVENYTLTVLIIDNKDNPVKGRKVGLYTNETTPVLLKEDVSDETGKVHFLSTVVGDYIIKLFDDEGTAVFAQTEKSVGANLTNSETFVIERIIHYSDIVITGYMNDPKGSDSPAVGAVSGGGFEHPGQYEYVQLMALKDINFSEDPYSVVFTNTGSPDEYGWAIGRYDSTSKKVYQINLENGSVSMGQYFYVGGLSRMIASYYQDYGSKQLSTDVFWGVDYYTNAGGNGNGAAKEGSGLLGNGSGKTQESVVKTDPNAIAVFKGINIDENTVPQDAIFFGTEPTYKAFQIPNNDVYSRVNPNTSEEQPLFNLGTNTYLFPVGAQDQGMFIKLGGKVTPEEWIIPRSGTPITFNLNDNPTASEAEIEKGENCTVFIDK